MTDVTSQRTTTVADRRLSIRLATSEADLIAVQRLRARVFLAEPVRACAGLPIDLLDSDVYDPLCDHLLVMDEDRPPCDRVVGTYRLLRESVARRTFGFYSEGEFNLATICHGPGRPNGELLELGRSCVLPPYRTSAAISLLWRGIADYVARHGIALMFGCASFPGTDPDAHAEALSYLCHHHLADPATRPSVLVGNGTDRKSVV